MTSNPIENACRLLREGAAELKNCHTLAATGHDWTGEPEAKAAYDEHMATADALERVHAECEALRTGYAAARLEIESLRGRVGVVPAPRSVTEPTQVELDAFILRAGFRPGWENLESWARRMAEQAVREINEARAMRAAQPATADDRAAFKAYLEDCDECAIVPDIAGAFHAGWTSRVRAAQPAGAQQPGAAYAALPDECDSPEICAISKTCAGQFGTKRICASHGQAPAQAASAAVAGCTRSHPHENMDSACRAKAAIAEMQNRAARGADATAYDLERWVAMLAAAPTTQPAPSVELGVLQAEIAGHEAANLHLSAMVDELRELLQDAKRAMTELHQAAIPDESAEGVPAIIPPDAFRAFVDAHEKLCFCLHQRGHNPVQDAQQPAPQQDATSVDLKTMELAESVGLIGPASRTHDLHAAIQRFHDLICANATIKAAQMAAEAISEAAPQQEPVAWANWKVGSTSYAPYRTREQAVASVNQSGIAATQEGPYEVVALYTAPQPSPASQGDALDAARYRWLRNKSTVLHNTAWLGGATAVQRDVDFLRRDDALAALDAAIDAARAAQEGK